MSSNLYTFLQDIHRCFPIGLDTDNRNYPGYQDLTSRLENTLSNIYQDSYDTTFINLKGIKGANEYFSGSSPALPSYRFMRLLNESSDNFLSRRTWIVGVVSYVSHCYCVWVSEQLTVLSPTGIPVANADIFRKILNDDEREEVEQVTELLKKQYPDHINAKYDLLQIMIKGGKPMGADPESKITEYPMFDFLFGKYSH